MSWINKDGVEKEDYIDSGDIKDSVVNSIEIEEYLSEATQEINDLAERVGVRDTDNIHTPLHYKIKRYGIVYALMRIFQDKVGVNNVEISDMDKYVIKFNIYKEELSRLRPLITYEMFTNQVNEIRDRVSTISIYRG